MGVGRRSVGAMIALNRSAWPPHRAAKLYCDLPAVVAGQNNTVYASSHESIAFLGIGRFNTLQAVKPRTRTRNNPREKKFRPGRQLSTYHHVFHEVPSIP